MTSTKTSLIDLQNKKIALVYDWFDSWGGAERVLLILHEMFPHADWFTSYIDEKKAGWAEGLNPTPSWMQSIPWIRTSKKLAAPLFPLAFESFMFDGYDCVVSITSSYAKGIITKPEVPHMCLMLTPTRFLWIKEDEYLGGSERVLGQPYLRYIKEWDMIAAQRPDHIIGISRTVAERIQTIYKREAEVIYPPFDLTYWEDTMRNMVAPITSLPEKYYVLVSRLRPYKKVDMAIRAFNTLPSENLIIVGSGTQSELRRLKGLAHSNIHFLSDLADAELAYLYGHAQALIMPQEEDFGYIALEALSCGCAVIAYNKGGATETVKHGKTGYLFEEQTEQGLINALEKFSSISYTVERYLQKNSRIEVEPFDKKTFITKFTSYISSKL